MTLADLAEQLTARGYAITLGDDASPDGPAFLALSNDIVGGQRVLAITLPPGDPEEPLLLLNFHVVYPLNAAEMDEDALGDLVRALFFLNRSLEFGHNGFCEEVGGVYFHYVHAFRRALPDQAASLDLLIGMIDDMTSWQGALLDRVGRGEIDADDVARALFEAEMPPRPLFPRNEAA